MENFLGWLTVAILGLFVLIGAIAILLALLGFDEPYDILCDFLQKIINEHLQLILAIVLLIMLIGFLILCPLDSVWQYAGVILIFLIFAAPYFLILSKHYKLAALFFTISFILGLFTQCS